MAGRYKRLGITLLLFAALFQHVAALYKVATCSPSVASYMTTLPEMAVWAPGVEKGSTSVVFEAECAGMLPNGFTIFAGTSESTSTAFSLVPDQVAEWLSITQGDAVAILKTPNGTICATKPKVETGKANAIALYNILPEGAFTAEQLLELGTVPTALSYLTNDTIYDLTFFEDKDGRVCSRGINATIDVCIVSSHVGCDGILHVSENILIPATSVPRLLSVNGTQYDIPLETLKAASPQERPCNTTLFSLMSNRTDLAKATADIMKGLTGGELLDIFTSPQSEVTYFAVNDAGYARAGTSPFKPDDDGRYRLETMNQVLQHPYCARELLQTNKVQPAFSVITNTPWPYTFDLDANGKLTIKSPDGRTANIVRADYACGSILYTIDAPLEIPNYRNDTEALQTKAAELLNSSIPILRPLACADGNGVSYEYDAYNSPSGTVAPPNSGNNTKPSTEGTDVDTSDGLSAGAIAGIAVGASIAAVGIISAAFLVRRRRKRQQQQPQLEKFIGEDDVSINLDTTVVISFPGTDDPTAGVDSEELKAPSSGSEKNMSSLQSSGPNRYGATDNWSIPPAAVEVSIDSSGRHVVLGRGGFGVVYRGVMNGVQDVAVKVVRHPSAESSESFLREIEILQRVSRDRNIVQFYGTCLVSDSLMIVTELMEGGDLRGALSGPRGSELRWNVKGRELALGIARGLCFLHANNVIHRDLKSKNVLLSADWSSAKIADVGAAAIHLDGYLTPGAGQVMGTLAWAAPELLLGQRCTSKVDIFSLGVLLWEVVTGQVPQRGFVAAPPPGPSCPEALSQLIFECLDADPTKRPTSREVYDRMQAC